MDAKFKKDEDFLNFEYKDISRSNLINWFTFDENNKRQFDPQTEILVDDKKINENASIRRFKNYNSLKGEKVTIGRIIVNVTLYDMKFEDFDVLNYVNFINKAFDKKTIAESNKQISMFIRYPIFTENNLGSMINSTYIDRITWLGFCYAPFSLPTLDYTSLNPSKEIKKERERLFNENKEIIENNDGLQFNKKVEEPMLAFAKKNLKDNNSQALMFYDSGIKGDFSNNYKTVSLFRGTSTHSDIPTELRVSTSSLVEGTIKEDIVANADVAVSGSLGRAIDTRMGGYKTKIFNSAFPSILLDKIGTDCKSPITIEVNINENNAAMYKSRYIVEKNKIILLEDNEFFSLNPKELNKMISAYKARNIEVKNIKDYYGKKVDMRSTHYCQSKYLCNTCIGNTYYRLKIKNIGLLANTISGQLMNFSMKAFHQPSVKTKEFNLFNFIQED